MGLFGQQPTVDAEFESHAIWSKDDDRKATLKAIAKNQGAIRTMLEPGESTLGMAYFMGDFGGDNLVVITNLRTATMKKAAVKQEFRHGEVAKTTIGLMPNQKLLVAVISKTAELDYAPNDSARFGHIIQFEVSTPRIAQTICAAIDQYL